MKTAPNAAEKMMKHLERFLLSLTAIGVLLGTSLLPAARASGLEELEMRIAQGASLADLAAYAYQTNPAIKGAREAWRGVIEKYRVETGYPDPEVSGAYYPKPLMAEYEVMVSQPIPFPGKLSKAGEVVEAEAQMARLELDKSLRDVIVALRESYHELLYIAEAKRVAALNRDLLERLRKVGETGYAQNRATFFDVTKAQSQSAQLQYDAVLLSELEEAEKAQLNSLLSRAPDSPIRLLPAEAPAPLAYDLGELYGLARKYQEEIRQAEAQINAARARMGLAKYEYLPMFRVGVSYAKGNYKMVPPEFRDAVGIQFGFSIPLWFDKNKGRVEEAKAEVQKAEALKAGQINNTNAQIRNVYFRVRNAERLIRLYRDQLLPQASQGLEIADTWLREGQGSFADLVETQGVHYNFQLSLARARADFGKYLAQLERLCGLSLVRPKGAEEEAGREEKGQ